MHRIALVAAVLVSACGSSPGHGSIGVVSSDPEPTCGALLRVQGTDEIAFMDPALPEADPCVPKLTADGPRCIPRSALWVTTWWTDGAPDLDCDASAWQIEGKAPASTGVVYVTHLAEQAGQWQIDRVARMVAPAVVRVGADQRGIRLPPESCEEAMMPAGDYLRSSTSLASSLVPLTSFPPCEGVRFQ
jgi:hypothetical protein